MAYVLGSWAKATHSHQKAQLYLSKHGPETPLPVYRRLFGEWQKRIAARADVLIACDDDDADCILGYLIVERRDDSPPVLHYVQVKRDLMRKGIAAALLDRAGIKRDEACIYTFTSPIQGKVKTPERWVYVPYWLTEST